MKILEEKTLQGLAEAVKSKLSTILEEDEVVEFAKEGVLMHGHGYGTEGMLLATNKRLLHLEIDMSGEEFEPIENRSIGYSEIRSLVIRHAMATDTQRDISIVGDNRNFDVEMLSLHEWNKFEQSILSKLDMERDAKSTYTSDSYTRKSVPTDEEIELEA